MTVKEMTKTVTIRAFSKRNLSRRKMKGKGK